jgi:NAD+ synthase (glutamine-hydrolysing)
MRTLRVALAQLNTTVGDLAGNSERILDAARRAADAGADLVAFPELAITGYPPEDLLIRAPFIKTQRAPSMNSRDARRVCRH